jgi:hypothetical protein
VLIPVLLTAVGTSIGLGEITLPSGGGQIGYSKWDAAKNEVEFMRLPYGSTFNYEVQVSFDVLFGDVEAVSGQPAIGTLHAIASEVECIVNATEAESARILSGRPV